MNLPGTLIKGLCASLLVLASAGGAATITVDGSKTYQVIEGFGVNANHRSWVNTEMQPVLDALIDQAGMTAFRVVYDNADWATNNNSTYLGINNPAYSGPEFNALWGMMAYLNQKGITNGMMLNFQGLGPSWMGGQSLASGYENQWAQMIASATAYAKKTRNLQFNLLGPNNEPDIPGSGIGVSASQYVTCLHDLAQQLDANGLSDIRLVGPDLSNSGVNWLSQIMSDSVVMAKVGHFGMHSYSANGSGSAGVSSYLKSSAYPNMTFWMTEFNVWCQVCQTGGAPTNNWAYFRGAAEYLLSHLANNASAGFIWDACDSPYLNNYDDGIHWTYWGLFGVNSINASPKIYTARKNFYTLAQITKYVRPGAVRIDVSGGTSTLSSLAFYSASTGQLAITGVNTASGSTTLSGNLKSLSSIGSLELYYTDANNNLRDNGAVSVNNGSFSVTIPGDCVYTLVASGTPAVTVSASITSPADGATFTAPATIQLQATASTSSGSITGVSFYNGTTSLGQDTATPYTTTWNNVPAGAYILTAYATNSSGVVGASSPVHVTVLGAPTITQQPQSQSLTAGGAASFSVTASGAAPLSYQWLYNGTSLGNGGQISGATTATLSLANVQSNNAGGYAVMVSNPAGSVTSSVATLAITPQGSCFPPPAGIVGWWPGDGTANDFTGTNNGALHTGATAAATGIVGQAFSFDGTNGYVQIPDSPALRPTNLTIEAWVRFSSLDSQGSGGSPAGDQYMVFKQNTLNANFEGFDLSKTRMSGNDVIRFVVSSSSGQSVEIDSATTISAGTWYHVAAVRGTNFTQLYINGVLERQASVTFAQNYGTLPVYFGTSGQSFWDHKLKGTLDEVSLYNRALSAAEIAAIYNAGSAGKCKTVTGLTITAQPQSQTVAAGINASFSVGANGAAPLGYQWFFNGAAMGGATTVTLALNNVQAANAGSYFVVVTNPTDAETSSVATLTVLLAPTITSQPQSLTNVAGTAASFTASATGSTPLGYQWQLNGVSLANGGRISGAKTNGLNISSVQASDAGNYTLVVSNAVGTATSAVAVLSILGPPTITTQPANQSVIIGSTATFNVSASGTPPLGYQWFFNGVTLVNGGQFSGADSPSLSVNNSQTNNGGSYFVVVTNGAGSATSVVANLAVTDPSSCFAPPSGIVGWWPGDGDANDITSTNNGTLKGNATATTAGMVAQAFNFDGTNGYVQIADSAVLRPTNFTIEAWVRFSSLDSQGSGGSPAGDQYIVFKQNSRSGNFEGYDLSKTRVTGGDVFRFLVASSAGAEVEIHSSTLIHTGIWYHVAAVRGTNFTQIYVNGALERQTNVTFAQNYGTLPVYFGTSGQSFWDHKLKGSLDEVSLYGRALSATEISGIYTAGVSGKCKSFQSQVVAGRAEIAPAGAIGVTLLLPPNFVPVTLVPDSNAAIALGAYPNLNCRIDVSTDLRSWTSLTHIPNANGPLQFIDPEATNATQRFYRAVWGP